MKVQILTPAFTEDAIHPAFRRSLETTLRAFEGRVRYEPVSPLLGCASIELARNTLLARFRAGSDGAAVFIDSDISWTPDDLAHVLAPIESGKAHVSAGLYVKKVPGAPQPVGQLLETDCDEANGYVGPRRELDGRRYARIDFAGAGFLAIDRHAVETVAALVPNYCPQHGWSITGRLDERAAFLFRGEIFTAATQPDTPRYRGEDHAACATIRSAGFEIWWALDSALSHHSKDRAYGGAPIDVDAFARRLAFSNDVMRRAAEGRPVPEPEVRRRLAAVMGAP